MGSQTIQGTDAVVCLAGTPRGAKKTSWLNKNETVGIPNMVTAIAVMVEAMKEHKVRRLLFQVGAFTRLSGERAPGCFEAYCIRDLLLGRCLGEAVSLEENQDVAAMLPRHN